MSSVESVLRRNTPVPHSEEDDSCCQGNQYLTTQRTFETDLSSNFSEDPNIIVNGFNSENKRYDGLARSYAAENTKTPRDENYYQVLGNKKAIFLSNIFCYFVISGLVFMGVFVAGMGDRSSLSAAVGYISLCGFDWCCISTYVARDDEVVEADSNNIRDTNKSGMTMERERPPFPNVPSTSIFGTEHGWRPNYSAYNSTDAYLNGNFTGGVEPSREPPNLAALVPNTQPTAPLPASSSPTSLPTSLEPPVLQLPQPAATVVQDAAANATPNNGEDATAS